MPEYEQYTGEERRRIEVLRKRRDWLKARVESSPVDLSFDKAEYSALSWALGVIANARKAQDGVSEGQELD